MPTLDDTQLAIRHGEGYTHAVAVIIECTRCLCATGQISLDLAPAVLGQVYKVMVKEEAK